MNDRPRRSRTAQALPALLLAILAPAWAATQGELLPRELPPRNIPINGTDQTEDPLYYRDQLGFGPRVGFKIVEHGDTPFFDDALHYLETPHTDWAAPYANGPVRVLFIADAKAQARYAIELKQRSDFDITILQVPAVLGETTRNKDATLEKIWQRMTAVLNREYDVIVVTRTAPLALLEQIKDKVEAGCGLVIMHQVGQWWTLGKPELALVHELSPISYGLQGASAMPERALERHPVIDGLSLAGSPLTTTGGGTADADAQVLATVRGLPIVAVGPYYAGRTVGLYYHVPGWGGLLPSVPLDVEESDPQWSDAYEPVYALYLRAIAWAARKEPRVDVSAPERVTVHAGEAAQVPMRVVSRRPETPAPTLRCRLQDPYGTRLAEALPTRAGGEAGSIAVDLPPLAVNGLHRLDWWVMKGDAVENWGCVGIQVAGGVVLTVEPAQSAAPVGGTATYRVASETTGTLQVTGIDDADRIFFNRTYPMKEAVSVEVDLARSLLPRNRVEFSLVRDDHVIARANRRLHVPRLGVAALNGEFCFAMYGTTDAEDHLLPYVGDLYRAVGINTYYHNWHSRGYIRTDFLTGLYSISGAMSPYLKQDNLRPVLSSCPNNPQTRAEWLKNITAAKNDFRMYGGIGRVLDDEAFLAWVKRDQGAQVCQCEYCLRAFREELRAKYGAVAALNDAWSATFTNWDQVRPLEENGKVRPPVETNTARPLEEDVGAAPDDLANLLEEDDKALPGPSEEQDAAARDNPAGWLEFRVFMNQVYARQYYGWIQEQHADLAPSYGVGGGAPQWGGIYHGSYHALRPVLKFMMLYSAEDFPDAFMGAAGAQKYEPPLNWQQFGPWNALFRGADALWFYYGSAIIGSELAWRRHAVWIESGIRDIREGAGVLIRDAKPVSPPVRVYDSIEQEGMRWLFGKRTNDTRILGSPATAGTLKTLFQRQGIPVGRIGPAEIARGGLSGCKLLVLSAASNMDDATATAIRDYVKAGGCALADVVPATREALGKPRAQSALQDLFGGPVAAGPPRGGLPAVTNGADSPAYTERTVGAGRAIFLDFVANDLNETTTSRYGMLADQLAALAHLSAPARILDVDSHKPLPHRPLYAFTYGKATLLGSIRGYLDWANNDPRLLDEGLGGPDTATFAWGEKRHIYNVRTGEYVGFADQATVDLPPFHGRLLALLPYRVTEVTLTAPEKAKAGDLVTLTAQVRTDGGDPGDHVLRMNVESPTGYRVPLYAQTRHGNDGKATFTIPYADNDRPGTWTVIVRDVLSGVEGRRSVAVK